MSSQLLSNLQQWSASFQQTINGFQPVSSAPATQAVTSNSQQTATTTTIGLSPSQLWGDLQQIDPLLNPLANIQGLGSSGSTPQATDPNQCTAFSITNPMPSVQCNLRKDAIYVGELILLMIIVVYGLKLLFPAVSNKIVETGNNVKRGATTVAEAGAAALA